MNLRQILGSSNSNDDFHFNTPQNFAHPPEAIVNWHLSPYQSGQVEWAGTLWLARFYLPRTKNIIRVKQYVEVFARAGNTLYVAPRFDE